MVEQPLEAPDVAGTIQAVAAIVVISNQVNNSSNRLATQGVADAFSPELHPMVHYVARTIWKTALIDAYHPAATVQAPGEPAS
jgi:hypothetical protein